MGRPARRALARSAADLARSGELPLGGTAVGTGINAPRGFAAAVVAALAAETGLPLRPTPTRWSTRAGRARWQRRRAGLRGVAVALTKVANDIRLLASGPSTGLGELLLPELQAGSSIMPGKVNPVLCESVNQVAARVFGNDATVGFAASQGILELNTYLPVMADALFESATLLANVCRVFAERCVAGIDGRRRALPGLRRALAGHRHRAEPDHRLRRRRRSSSTAPSTSGARSSTSWSRPASSTRPRPDRSSIRSP